jgi:exonuclease VII large subunit
MRLLICVLFAVSLAFAAPGQESKSELEKIGAGEADKHFQETCIVTGKVAQVTVREKLVYVNLDKKFPETPLTCVIFARATNQFGDIKKLEGKQVEVKGKIEEYRDKLQIVLSSTNQLKVVEPGKAEKPN